MTTEIDPVVAEITASAAVVLKRRDTGPELYGDAPYTTARNALIPAAVEEADAGAGPAPELLTAAWRKWSLRWDALYLGAKDRRWAERASSRVTP